MPIKYALILEPIDQSYTFKELYNFLLLGHTVSILWEYELHKVKYQKKLLVLSAWVSLNPVILPIWVQAQAEANLSLALF